MTMTSGPLSPSTAVLLLADYQTAVLDHVVKAPPREQVEANVLRLARAATALGIPAIFTTSAENQNGTLMAALEQAAPDAYASHVERHGTIDALADPAVSDALGAVSRRQLIIAGIGIEVCGVAPALHARRDGYQVTFVADAAGSLTDLGHDISLRRMEHEGIIVATTATVVAELAGDYATYAKIMRG